MLQSQSFHWYVGFWRKIDFNYFHLQWIWIRISFIHFSKNSPQNNYIASILNIVVYASRWVPQEPSRTIEWSYWNFPKSTRRYCEYHALSTKIKDNLMRPSCIFKSYLNNNCNFQLEINKTSTYVRFSSHPPLIFVMWALEIFWVLNFVVFVKSLLKLLYNPVVVWCAIDGLGKFSEIDKIFLPFLRHVSPSKKSFEK